MRFQGIMTLSHVCKFEYTHYQTITRMAFAAFLREDYQCWKQPAFTARDIS